MKGLIIKDFLNIKKQATPMLLFITLYFFISLITGNSSFFTGILMIFCAMLPITSLSYDDKSGFAKYALTLPVSRQTIIKSKYMMALILLGFGSIITFFSNTFIGNLTFTENLLSIIITIFIDSIIISISLPAIFKFGIEKGRFIMIGSFLFIGFLGGIISMTVTNGNIGTHNIDFLPVYIFSTFFSNNIVFFAFLIVASISAILLLISMCLSISIYNRKDF